MDDWGGILSMLASAAIQKRAQDQALDRQRSMALAAQQRQLQSQDQATAVAMQRAAAYDPAMRQQAQQQIQQDLTGQYNQQLAQPMVTAQGVQVGATLPEGQGGAEYTAAKAREQAKALASARQLAQTMGRIGSADQLRQNEGVAMGDTAGEIGRVQGHAQQIAGIDQIGIENGAQVGVGPMLASAALRGYGMSSMAKAGLGAKKPQYDFSGYGAPSGATGGWV